jgi:hypothetical protein
LIVQLDQRCSISYISRSLFCFISLNPELHYGLAPYWASITVTWYTFAHPKKQKKIRLLSFKQLPAAIRTGLVSFVGNPELHYGLASYWTS